MPETKTELLIALEKKEEREMGHFIVGVLSGILICGVVMLVRCAAWYEHKHPEDDYWHRRVLPYAHEKQNALLKAAKDMACSDISEEVFNGKEG
jgi:hypothetical protein